MRVVEMWKPCRRRNASQPAGIRAPRGMLSRPQDTEGVDPYGWTAKGFK